MKDVNAKPCPTNRLTDDEHGAALAAAQRRIVSHHGYREKELCDGLARTVYAVFVPNRDELLGLLQHAATDVNLAVELFQNVRRPVVRRRFEGAVMRTLHNYFAASVALVDHSRHVLSGRSGPLLDEFEQRKVAVNAYGEVPFVHDLRNFVLHRSLPFIGNEVHVQPRPGIATAEIKLSVEDLVKWGGWKAPAKRYIASQGDTIALRPVIGRHAELVVDLNLWLYEQLAAANEPALAEVNELMVERNAILGGTTIEEARRVTEVWTKMRESPTGDPNGSIEMRMPRQHAA